MIDLRSDTVTVPSPEMRRAMAAAEVGDDGYGEDPSINALEERAAKTIGKERAIFVPSGTMGNLLAYLTHAPAGGEAICPESSHTVLSEAGGSARVARVSVRTVRQKNARIDIGAYRDKIRPADLVTPGTVLLWLEQPTSGYVAPIEDLRDLRALGITGADIDAAIDIVREALRAA